MDKIKSLTKTALALMALAVLVAFCVPDRRPMVSHIDRPALMGRDGR